MSETICWTCRRGPRSECLWFAEHRPVPGWTARRRDVLMPAGVREESYRVSACPLYLPDPSGDGAEAGGPYGAPLCRSGGAGGRSGADRDPAADRAIAEDCLACAEWLERRKNIQDTETGGGAWN